MPTLKRQAGRSRLKRTEKVSVSVKESEEKSYLEAGFEELQQRRMDQNHRIKELWSRKLTITLNEDVAVDLSKQCFEGRVEAVH